MRKSTMIKTALLLAVGFKLGSLFAAGTIANNGDLGQLNSVEFTTISEASAYDDDLANLMGGCFSDACLGCVDDCLDPVEQ